MKTGAISLASLLLVSVNSVALPSEPAAQTPRLTFDKTMPRAVLESYLLCLRDQANDRLLLC